MWAVICCSLAPSNQLVHPLGCTGLGRLTAVTSLELDMPNGAVDSWAGLLPVIAQQLPQLRHLSLVGCKLPGDPAAELMCLTALSQLTSFGLHQSHTLGEAVTQLLAGLLAGSDGRPGLQNLNVRAMVTPDAVLSTSQLTGLEALTMVNSTLPVCLCCAAGA